MSLANMQGKLSRAEMKDVLAGEIYDPGDISSPGTLIDDIGGGDCDAKQTYPKIEACKGLKEGMSCQYTLNKRTYTGTCQYVLSGPLFCYVGFQW
jgi:hypothetical protein